MIQLHQYLEDVQKYQHPTPQLLTCSALFVDILFTIARKWKQSNVLQQMNV